MEALRKADETGGTDWQWSKDRTLGIATSRPTPTRSLDNDSETSFGGIVTWERLLDRESSSILAFRRPSPNILLQVADEKAEDRLALLSKKYATSMHALSREDEARLQIISADMSIETPRYTVQDRAVMDEARALLAELEER